jgi:hypothetical protein
VRAFKAFHRRRWKRVVNGEFRRLHGVDLRTVGEIVGPTTLHDLLNDEYELAAHDPARGAQNVTHMLARVFRVDIAALETRDVALAIAPFRGTAPRYSGSRI